MGGSIHEKLGEQENSSRYLENFNFLNMSAVT